MTKGGIDNGVTVFWLAGKYLSRGKIDLATICKVFFRGGKTSVF